MEYDNSGAKDQSSGDNKCCQPHHCLVCCRSWPRAICTCCLCGPLVLICLALLVLVIWGAASGGDEPEFTELEAKIAFSGNVQGDQADFVAQLSANDTLKAVLLAPFSGSAQFDSASVSARKDGAWEAVVSVFGADGLFNASDAQIGATMEQQFATYGFTVDGVQASAVYDTFPMVCAMKGVSTASAVNKPLCKGALIAAFDASKSEIESKVDDNMDGDYTVSSMGMDSSGNVWVQFDYDNENAGYPYNSDNAMLLQCETYVDIYNAIDEVSKQIKDYFSQCEVSTEALSCRIPFTGKLLTAATHSSCQTEDADGDLQCVGNGGALQTVTLSSNIKATNVMNADVTGGACSA